jgi:Spy/CpxP family protein refolding chaperone
MLQKLLLAGLLAGAMAYAQDATNGQMGGMGGGGRGGRGSQMGGEEGMGGMPRAKRQSKTDQIADKLKLNKEQKEQMLTIFSAAREKATPVRDQMEKQRAEIAGAMINGKTGDELQKLLADYSATAAQMTGVEAEAYGKIYATLKPNQQKNAGQAFDLMAGLFSAPARGGQGRGRGEAR